MTRLTTKTLPRSRVAIPIMSPMRILHLSTRLILGGSQENTVLSCEGQANDGHEVHLAFGPIYGPEGSLLDRVESFGKITTHVVPSLVRELAPIQDPRAYRQCRALIREIKPDIVHTHSSKAGIIGRAAAWKEGVPGVVHTIHGLPFHPFQAKWRNTLYIALEKFAAKRCHRIATVCDAMTRQARAVGIGRDEQFVTVYSGMEVNAFLDPGVSRAEMRGLLGLEDDDFVIGTVARLAELKGHDDLLDALGDDLKANPNWKLLWVGDGWWAERLLGRVRDMGLADQVVHTGLVPPEDVAKMVQAMDVLAHPSYREGLPRTVPQALLGGVPVIVYDVDGGPEVCIPSETGILVKPGDHHGLRDAARWMASNPEGRVKMGQTGRERCETQFSTEKMVADLDRLYQELVAS